MPGGRITKAYVRLVTIYQPMMHKVLPFLPMSPFTINNLVTYSRTKKRRINHTNVYSDCWWFETPLFWCDVNVMRKCDEMCHTSSVTSMSRIDGCDVAGAYSASGEGWSWQIIGIWNEITNWRYIVFNQKLPTFSKMNRQQNGIHYQTIHTSNVENVNLEHDDTLSVRIVLFLITHDHVDDVTKVRCMGTVCECDFYLCVA